MINRDVTAKEQVIRFGFDFFKFVGSVAGTAKTGFNDLTFKVTPLEGTNEITGAETDIPTSSEVRSVKFLSKICRIKQPNFYTKKGKEIQAKINVKYLDNLSKVIRHFEYSLRLRENGKWIIIASDNKPSGLIFFLNIRSYDVHSCYNLYA